MSFGERELSSLRTIARAAGDAILEVYGREDFGARLKSDDSPLTEADLAAHRIIVAGLAEAFPEIPVLSEESDASVRETRKTWTRFFLVDPLDGTKEFIKRNGEFTVNIALIEDGRPVAGVVWAPVPERAFWGAEGEGAWTQAGDEGARACRLDPRPSPPKELRLVASRSHLNEATQAFVAGLEAKGHRATLVSKGSSLKLCLVGTGEADLYPRLGPTMEWDTAAAHAFVSAAGGSVVDTQGEALRYNKEDLLNPHFLVSGRDPSSTWIA